ncbi:MAG: DUF2207 domain-containing protein [Methanobacteriaceae archaeon]|nr:DUF2207 domain-containing protein [Methanobacteriaceae archaeon]MDP2835445.1 DUF2207 domain-containing protein [Methanobacteriaceae archaeon]MDP3035116.1 DUF2207 domain-containing protein [Methanobacteriaceae archaeon]MDP3484800.1 DUF2207 domain-containing protein [Methanobacteriaceae archaeon]MDP3623099.1 DUF2207 domain-containing protein [Methanobacteriaceae archaeon]
MDKKHFISFIFIFLITISLCCSASFADNSYSVPLMNIDLFVLDDGSIHVKETVHYSFQGTFHGVYRDIPLNGQQVENLKVTSSGAYSTYTVTNQSNNVHIKVNLYSDAAKTIPITDKSVDVTYEYDFTQVIKFYNDITELQYKLVGSGWSVDIEKMVVNIHLNSSSGVKYWLNPPYYAENSAWKGNELQVTSANIPSGNYFELRMLIPKNQFLANPTNGIIIKQNAAASIEKMQTDYQNQLNFKHLLYSFLSVILILACFIPCIIYWKYGREPKINYQAEYERDIPSNDPPAIVNAICGPGFSKKVGEADMDGFKATIMDLIDRKYFSISSKDSEKEGYGLDVSKSIFFNLNQSKDPEILDDFESYVYNFLKSFEENGTISLDEISNSLSNPEEARIFKGAYLNWKGAIKTQFLNDEKLQEVFLKKGDNLIKIFGTGGIIVAAIVFFVSLFDLPVAGSAMLCAIALGFVSIISLILPQKIGGQWTTYGEEYDAKWQNFKKYINDFSLIKEYPPESVKIWNKYLVYATALGSAEAVRKAMELSLPTDQLESSEMFMFHYYGGYYLLTSSLDMGMGPSSANGDVGDIMGTIGDIGGGFGGGGGGAF